MIASNKKTNKPIEIIKNNSINSVGMPKEVYGRTVYFAAIRSFIFERRPRKSSN